jgi:hypothetical protein
MMSIARRFLDILATSTLLVALGAAALDLVVHVV